MSTNNINIRISSTGARVVTRDINSIGDSARNAATNGVDFLKRSLAGLAAGAGVAALVQLSDQYTVIQNRLRLTTKDQGNLNAVFAELQQISMDTRSSLMSNTELFSRMSLAAKDLGRSQSEVLTFTKSLNQAIKLSGTTAVEAEAGLIQLSQGIASGTLRGDELRSVLEQLPAVADVITQHMGITRGELRKMGEQGKITADIILDAFAAARAELEEKFAKTIPTIAEGFQMIKNQLVVTTGELMTASGASDMLGSALKGIADWLKAVTPGLVNFTRAITGTLDPVDEMSTGSQLLASALVIVYGVLKSIGSLLTGTVILAFQTVGKAIGGISAAVVAAVQGDFGLALELVKQTGSDIGTNWNNSVVEMSDNAIGATADMFVKLNQIWDKGARDIQDRSKLKVGAIDTAVGVDRTPKPVDPNAEKEMRKLENALRGVLNQIAPIEGAMLEMAKAQEILRQATEKKLITAEQEARYLELLKLHYADILDPLGKLNREIDQQVQLLGLSAAAREVEAQVLAATTDLLKQGIMLTKEETAALREKLTALQELTRITEVQDELLAGSVGQRQAYVDQLNAISALLADPNSGFSQTDATAALMQSTPELFEGTQEAIDLQLAQFQYLYEQIDIMRQKNVISEQTAQQMIAKVQAQQMEMRLKGASSFFGNLASLTKSGNAKLFKIGQAAALAQAVIDGALAVQKAYTGTPYPFNIAAAAAQAIASGVQIAQIASAQPPGFQTGGEFKVGGSGGADSQMVSFRATPGERVAVSTPGQIRKGDPNRDNGMAPTINFKPNIINVRDPKEIPMAIESDEGQQSIINVIGDNAGVIREMLKG